MISITSIYVSIILFIEQHIANRFASVKGRIRRLPALHQVVLRAVLFHLAKVLSHHKENRMDSKNLAIVFSTVIFGEEELPPGVNVLSMAKVRFLQTYGNYHNSTETGCLNGRSDQQYSINL